MRTGLGALIFLLAACGGQQVPTQEPPATVPRSAEVTTIPSLTPTARVRPGPTTSVADPVEAVAREHCPAQVPDLYERCVFEWGVLMTMLPIRKFVLCVWPDGNFQIEKPGIAGAGSEIGDECRRPSNGTGTVTWIVSEGRDVEAEAREHCPDNVPYLYERCVDDFVLVASAMPHTRFVLCVWPDGRWQIEEPGGYEGAGSEIGDECRSPSNGTGTVTWIVNEGR